MVRQLRDLDSSRQDYFGIRCTVLVTKGVGESEYTVNPGSMTSLSTRVRTLFLQLKSNPDWWKMKEP